jgi:MFS transporter, PAT family, beta-lactamase induction signal transducer AmpG
LHTDVFHHNPNVNGNDWVDAWRVIFIIIAVMVLILPFWHMRHMPAGEPAAHVPKGARDALRILGDTFVTLFQKRDVWIMIVFALTYRISVGFLQRIGPFFMVDPLADGGLGLSNEHLGIIYGTYGLVAALAGSLLGGLFVSKHGTRSSLLWLCATLQIPLVAFVLMAVFQPTNLTVISLCVVVEKFFNGFGGLGLNLYLMQQLAPGKYTTTHYAFGTALGGLCMMVTGAVSGHLQQFFGYPHYFMFIMLAAIPPFLLTRFVPFHLVENRS